MSISSSALYEKNKSSSQQQLIKLSSVNYSVAGESIWGERYTWTKIELNYHNVHGRLIAKNPVIGFNVYTDTDENIIGRIRVYKNKIVLYVNIQYYKVNDFHSVSISYMHSPNLEIVDQSGKTIPKLEGFIIDKPCNISPFVNLIYVSDLILYNGEIINFSYPYNINTINFKKMVYPHSVCNIPEIYSTDVINNNIILYRLNIFCVETMELILHMGYSGSIKVWYNGAELCVSDCRQYILFKDLSVNITAQKGIHEVLVALKVKCCKATAISGVAIQFERVSNNAENQKILPVILP
mgnify:CR=1 FL=1